MKLQNLIHILIGIVCVGLLPDARPLAGATFAPTEEERVAATEQGFNGELKLAVLPRKVDPEGRTYVEVDDMLFWVREGAGIESAFTGNRWTNGIVYYVFDAAVSSTNRQNWRDAAADWSAVAPLTFTEGTGSGNYIYVQNGSGNNSYVGMIGGAQVMNIFNWTYEYIIAHEIGHALGLIHEQQRSGRDSYVTINYSYIQSGYEGNFYIAGSTNYGTYDFDSVMHYDKCAFSTDCPPGYTCACTNYTITVLPPNTQWQGLIGQRTHLSQLDGTGMAQRYGGGGGPPNDQCIGAIALSAGATRTANTANATSTGDPTPTCVSNFGKGVWYSFTPTTNAKVTISTCGSDFDTVLQIYTGSCAALTPVPNLCDDDDGPSCEGLQASVSFAGTAGTTYRILAGGYGSETGNLRIVASVPAPPATSDQCISAIALSAGATRTANTANATSTGDPTPTCVSNFGKGVWYSFTPTTNAKVTISTCGSDFDTVLQIYTGSCAALTPVPNLCDDDDGPSCEGLQASVSFAGTAGTTYRILAGGYGSETGNLRIVASVPAPPAATDFNGDGKPDYLLFNSTTHATAIWYMNNNVHVGGGTGPTIPGGWSLVGVADFNRDDKPDYLLFNSTTHATAIWYMNNNVHVGGGTGPTIPGGWSLVGVADFNRDDKPDYLLFNSTTHATAIWYMNNNVHVGGGTGPTIPGGWSLVGVADFNRDDKPDYLLFNSTTHATAIWYMNNNVHVGGGTGPTIPGGWSLVGVADFNRDDKPDYLLFNSTTHATAIWYMNNNVHVGGGTGPTIPGGWSLVAP